MPGNGPPRRGEWLRSTPPTTSSAGAAGPVHGGPQSRSPESSPTGGDAGPAGEHAAALGPPPPPKTRPVTARFDTSDLLHQRNATTTPRGDGYRHHPRGAQPTRARAGDGAAARVGSDRAAGTPPVTAASPAPTPDVRGRERAGRDLWEVPREDARRDRREGAFLRGLALAGDHARPRPARRGARRGGCAGGRAGRLTVHGSSTGRSSTGGRGRPCPGRAARRPAPSAPQPSSDTWSGESIFAGR